MRKCEGEGERCSGSGQESGGGRNVQQKRVTGGPAEPLRVIEDTFAHCTICCSSAVSLFRRGVR